MASNNKNLSGKCTCPTSTSLEQEKLFGITIAKVACPESPCRWAAVQCSWDLHSEFGVRRSKNPANPPLLRYFPYVCALAPKSFGLSMPDADYFGGLSDFSIAFPKHAGGIRGADEDGPGCQLPRSGRY